MKNAIKLLLIVLLVSGCRTKLRIAEETTKRTVRDSIARKEVVKDTVLIIKEADTVKLRSIIDDLTDEAIVKKSKYVTASLRKVGNEVEVECFTDELEAALQLHKEVIEYYKTIVEETQKTIVLPPEPYTPWYMKALGFLGGGGILFFVLRKLPILKLLG